MCTDLAPISSITALIKSPWSSCVSVFRIGPEVSPPMTEQIRRDDPESAFEMGRHTTPLSAGAARGVQQEQDIALSRISVIH